MPCRDGREHQDAEAAEAAFRHLYSHHAELETLVEKAAAEGLLPPECADELVRIKAKYALATKPKPGRRVTLEEFANHARGL